MEKQRRLQDSVATLKWLIAVLADGGRWMNDDPPGDDVGIRRRCRS
jgi:hypothetical protein